jgi:prepilin-type N-terminal cleavage/methylation domain-containing protein
MKTIENSSLSMAQLKARIYDNRGMTLIEVLIVIVIMAIITPVVTGAFTAGQKTFVKQSSEVQFREDADYVTTMIMNEFFSTPFDKAGSCTTELNCITIIDNKEMQLTPVTGEDKKADYGVGSENKATIVEKSIRFVSSGGKTAVEVKDAILETESDFAGSTLEFDCSEPSKDADPCETGTILLHFELSNAITKQSLTLESRFGF